MKEPLEEVDVVRGRMVQEESGVESSSLEELKIKDLVVSFTPKRLEDHLAVFGEPDEIIRIYRDHPEYLNAVRVDEEGCADSGCSNIRVIK